MYKKTSIKASICSKMKLKSAIRDSRKSANLNF